MTTKYHEGFCRTCQVWGHWGQCPQCGTVIIPLSLEKRFMQQADELSKEIIKVMYHIRCDSSYPTRSYIGEIYNAIVGAYLVGKQGKKKT
jgi:hypothetical protein